MNNLYLKPDVPGAYSGLSKFKKHHPKTNKKDVIEQPAYYLHYPVRRKFKRRQTQVNGINEQWQIDLLDIKKYKSQNSHFTYLLTCIDVFSKYAWVVPIKHKTAENCRDALNKIFQEAVPRYIYSDKGREFMGVCNQLFKENGIVHLMTQSINKASVVERFNRTLKDKIWRYLSRNPKSKSKRFINVLPELVKSNNSTYHRAIKTSPDQVNKKNEEEIRNNLYDQDINFVDLETLKDPTVISNNLVKLKFQIGDYVRKVDDDDLKVEKTRFNRGHLEKWTTNLFIIKHIIPLDPPTYILYDVNNHQVLDRKYYKEELQQALNVNQDTYKLIKSIKDKYLVLKVNSPTQEEILVDEKFMKHNNVHYN